MVKDAVEGLKAVGLSRNWFPAAAPAPIISRRGSGVYNELQCGLYAFMDADYGRILDKDGHRIDKGDRENALFILTSVMSHAKPDRAICDAGLKVLGHRQRPALHLRPRRREIHQVQRRGHRDR